MPIDPDDVYPVPAACEYCGQECREGTVCEECRSLFAADPEKKKSIDEHWAYLQRLEDAQELSMMYDDVK